MGRKDREQRMLVDDGCWNCEYYHTGPISKGSAHQPPEAYYHSTGECREGSACDVDGNWPPINGQAHCGKHLEGTPFTIRNQ